MTLAGTGSIPTDADAACEESPVLPGAPLHICLVSQEFPPSTARGGIGTQTYLKAHGLAALGHSVRVISRSNDAERHEYFDGPVHVIRVPGMDHQFGIHTTIADWVTYSASVASAIAASHEASPIDIIDFPEWGCEGFVHLLNRSQWNSIPTVIHLHGPLVMFGHKIGWPELESEFFRTGTAMEGACLRMADRIFSSSDCSRDWCAREYGIDAANVPTIHTGVDVELFRPLGGSGSEQLTIVFVGNLSLNKGVGVLADAALRLVLEFPSLRVKLLGSPKPDLAESLRERAAACGVPNLFDFLGFVDRNDVPRHLSAADVFAAPSCYEGGPGFVYLEAMACGIPVIACSGSGSSEAVVDGETGLLVPPNDSGALVTALRRLLSDTALRQSMGQRGRAEVLRRADSRKCIRDIEAFYAQTVATLRSQGER
ncbi:glycosyltransferase family 4 protein [Humisphaera borealis]|uniref:Glycosyltransferase family 4 protein n=1 Tax=Humisphaera borealis TaxID=2807512 RepID=A0A7M2WXC5_9BACT|nr:glycosyltransferase family 4 protein [Humisphaera borealis]QOV90177.1 glycosyltransferase family 4 protein [Humisphaera borealis]